MMNTKANILWFLEHDLNVTVLDLFTISDVITLMQLLVRFKNHKWIYNKKLICKLVIREMLNAN